MAPSNSSKSFNSCQLFGVTVVHESMDHQVVNQGHLTGSQPCVNPTSVVVPNTTNPQTPPPTSGHGQFFLSKKVTQVMKSTSFTPYRAHGPNDQSSRFPGQYQPIVPLGKVAVTEAVTTTTTKTLIPFHAKELRPLVIIPDNDDDKDNNQHVSVNQNNVKFLDFRNSNVSNRNQQNRNGAESSKVAKLADRNQQNRNGAGSSQVAKRADRNQQNRNGARSSQVAKRADADKIIDRTGNKGDGKTHSLPHKKHGPYTCPKCNKVSLTSQKFAAHALFHYKGESYEETRARWAAKYKRQNLQLAYGPGAIQLTIVPTSRGRPKGKSAGRKKHNTKDKMQLVNQPDAGGASSSAAAPSNAVQLVNQPDAGGASTSAAAPSNALQLFNPPDAGGASTSAAAPSNALVNVGIKEERAMI